MDSRISSVSVAQEPIAMRAPSTVASNTAPVELKIPKAEIKVDTETLKKNLEVAINHSFFTGREIESERLQIFYSGDIAIAYVPS
jgi:hypothetical protein